MKKAFDRSESVDVFHQLSFVINFFRKEIEKEKAVWEDKKLDLRVSEACAIDEKREYFSRNVERSYAKNNLFWN